VAKVSKLQSDVAKLIHFIHKFIITVRKKCFVCRKGTVLFPIIQRMGEKTSWCDAFPWEKAQASLSSLLHGGRRILAPPPTEGMTDILPFGNNVLRCHACTFPFSLIPYYI